MDWREDSLSPETDFIDAVVKQVRFRPDRRAIAEELRQHLDESAAWLEEERQFSPEEARKAALAQMGDPEAVGEGLNLTHKPLLGWAWYLSRILCVTVCLTLGLYLAYVLVGVTVITVVDSLGQTVFYRYQKPVERVISVEKTFDLGPHTMTIDEVALLEDGSAMVRYHGIGGPRVNWHAPEIRVLDEEGEGLAGGGSSTAGWINWKVSDFKLPDGTETLTLGWPDIDPDAVVTIDLTGGEGGAA